MALQSINPADAFASLTPQQREKMTLDHRVKVKSAAIFLRSTLVQIGVVLAWIISLQVIALVFFTRGFLLSRPVLENHSTCIHVPSLLHKDYDSPSIVEDLESSSATTITDNTNDSSTRFRNIHPAYDFDSNDTYYSGSSPLHNFSTSGCWHPKAFDRAVILVIDALRFDFTVPGPETSSHYLNGLPFMYDTSISSPENALLLKFIADPPTTTLQRLKGLTTGSLPTFIDAGSNFAGTEILEDSWISQLSTLANNSIAFTGDDTWVSLFEPLFHPNLSYPYESLNVMDLYTVDNGVKEHLLPFIESPALNSQWKVAIGHMLGVDHAGHRYGPEHPVMKEKLQEMDQFLRILTDKIDDDTLLIVMGDHGMDPQGNHGGESLPELEAALWMYSKRPSWGRLPDPLNTIYDDSNYGEKHRSVAQIDLVPTLSLLLGLPIPFNNLGFPISEAFLNPTHLHSQNEQDYLQTSAENLARAQLLTAAQIRRYTLVDGSLSKFDNIERLWANISSLVKSSTPDNSRAEEIIEATQLYHKTVLEEYRVLWIKFDISSMLIGITFMISSIIIIYTYARVIPTELDEMTGPLLKVVNSSASVMGLLFWAFSRVAIKARATDPDSNLLLATVGTLLPRFLTSSVDSLLLGVGSGVVIGFLGMFTAAFAVANSLRTTLSMFLVPKSTSGFLALFFTIAHAALFASNSYTVWEDRGLLFLLASLTFYYLFISLGFSSKLGFWFGNSSNSSQSSSSSSNSSTTASGGSTGSSNSVDSLVSGNASPSSLSSIQLSAADKEEQEKLKKRKIMAIYFCVSFLILLRIASYSTVCREEQGTACRVTFYSSSLSSVSSMTSIGLLAFSGVYLPTVIAAFFDSSANMNGPAVAWISFGLRVIMFIIAGYWLVDGLEDRGYFSSLSPSALEQIKYAKITTARIVLGIALIAANYAWWRNSLCVKIEMMRGPNPNASGKNATQKSKNIAAALPGVGLQAKLIGYGNTYGSMIMLAILNVFAATLMFSKPMGGLSLCVLLYQIFAVLELFDIHEHKLYFSALGPVTLGLLGSFHFFTTGHQATIPSLQWNVAYIASSSIVFPITHLALIFNTFASQILVSLSVPLLVLWKVPPSKTPSPLLRLAARSGLSLILYQSVIALSSMIFALHFRRHLMVWKIFAPRFMLAGLALGVVDVFVFLGVVVMAGRSVLFINRVFNT